MMYLKNLTRNIELMKYFVYFQTKLRLSTLFIQTDKYLIWVLAIHSFFLLIKEN